MIPCTRDARSTRFPDRGPHHESQRGDPRIGKAWYPEVVKFSADGSDELRVTAAWVMGQDNQSPEFHAALLKLLTDPNPMVQRNAALSLVRFADTSGHDIIAACSLRTPWLRLALGSFQSG